MKLSFHGADQGVTGSCHLIECAGRKVLVDCGLFQGGRVLEEENAKDFGFDPGEIDFVLLTHAHLDHCGRLPVLVKRGFRGKIVSTSASRDLCRLVLIDAAHLQEEEARYANSLAHRRGSHEVHEPLFGLIDVLDTFDRFGPDVAYGETITLADGIVATFSDAGHILGAASVLLELAEGDERRRVLFSGDLGNSGRPLLRDPIPPADIDVAIMESTYGDRNHRSFAESVAELYEALNESLRRGGNVIIPTFALERAQELLYYMHQGVAQNRLPASLNVFLDSPMAISATEIFKRHPECYDPDIATLFANGQDPFHLPGLRFTREAADSMALNRIRGGAVIMAGSGMCNGGRVRHHLRHNLAHADATVIFVGFAAVGTLARSIIDGTREISIFGEPIRVRARIYTINGFSAHADQAELLSWHNRTGARRTFLTHGEPGAMEALRHKLGDELVVMPKQGDIFDL